MSQTSAPKDELPPTSGQTFDQEENKKSISHTESAAVLNGNDNGHTKTTLRSASDGNSEFSCLIPLANLGMQLADLKNKRKRVQQDVK